MCFAWSLLGDPKPWPPMRRARALYMGLKHWWKTLRQNNTVTAKQCFSQHVTPDLVDEFRFVNDNDAQNLSMGPGTHRLWHSGVQMACVYTLTSSRHVTTDIDTEISKSNFDLRGLDRKCRCAAMNCHALNHHKYHVLTRLTN